MWREEKEVEEVEHKFLWRWSMIMMITTALLLSDPLLKSIFPRISWNMYFYSPRFPHNPICLRKIRFFAEPLGKKYWRRTRSMEWVIGWSHFVGIGSARHVQLWWSPFARFSQRLWNKMGGWWAIIIFYNLPIISTSAWMSVNKRYSLFFFTRRKLHRPHFISRPEPERRNTYNNNNVFTTLSSLKDTTPWGRKLA